MTSLPAFRVLRLPTFVLLASLATSGFHVMGKEPETIRIATYNVSLYGKEAGEIRQRLSDANDSQARKIAAIIQIVRPDVLLVNELDYEPDQGPARLLAENYFARPQQAVGSGEPLLPLEYPYVYSAPSNTGIDSSMDLNLDGQTGTGDDAWGYGVYPGQYAMTVFSRFPIDHAAIRTFQTFLWKDFPGAIRPIDPKTDRPFHPDAVWNSLRLSSKNHIDVPIQVGDAKLHVLGSHPTPPVFDGPEDRNGARNHDEVEFWSRYLTDENDQWIIDDRGRRGGYSNGEPFVIMGDLNADPVSGSGRREAIQRLLGLSVVKAVSPKTSDASVADALRDKTADWRNGRMRVDYVIPSERMHVADSGVFWPADSEPGSKLVDASDHRLVWVDAVLTPN
ncbi:MAG: endonuclease/exonuclease/phosphatase family protein, partial [Planctomycetota bacterium]